MAHSPIDLRSDTVTRPSPEMRRAMAEAEVGDDVFIEDPTVNRLQERAAGIFKREAALFVPSGTMGNLTCIIAACWFISMARASLMRQPISVRTPPGSPKDSIRFNFV